jgi:hypothetical protein
MTLKIENTKLVLFDQQVLVKETYFFHEGMMIKFVNYVNKFKTISKKLAQIH